jgi:hypothetical protein
MFGGEEAKALITMLILNRRWTYPTDWICRERHLTGWCAAAVETDWSCWRRRNKKGADFAACFFLPLFGCLASTRLSSLRACAVPSWSECILVVSVLARGCAAGRGVVGGIVTMSDDDHHFESKADAGASKTFPQQAGTIRKNAYLVIKTRPCKVRPSFPSSLLRTPRRLSFKGFIRCTGLIVG